MGSKGHGTYAKLYGDVWTHPKTLRLAEGLEALGVPRRWSIREAVGQLHELLIWCLGASDDGEVGHLRPEMFARVVGWTDERKASGLVAAWRASGFLDERQEDDGTHWSLHDFEECASDIIAKRRARRAAQEQRRGGGGKETRTDAERPPDGGRADALARASGSGSGNGSGNGSGSTPVAPSLAVDVSERIADQWARECGHLPQPVRPLPPKLREAAEEAERQSPDRDWGATFARVARSDFLSGRVKGWRANLGWALTAENLAKLDSGNYDQGQRGSKRANDLAASAAAASQILDAVFGDAP